MYRVAKRIQCCGLTWAKRCALCQYNGVGQRLQSTHSGSGGGKGKVFLFLFGTTVAGVGGTIAYSGYDPNFRKSVQANVPYANVVLDYFLDKDGDAKVQPSARRESSLPSQGGVSKEKALESSLLRRKLDRESAKKSESGVLPAKSEDAKPAASVVQPIIAPPALPPPPPIESPPVSKRSEESVSKQRLQQQEKDVGKSNENLEKTLSDLQKALTKASVSAIDSLQYAVNAVKAHTGAMHAAVEEGSETLSEKTTPAVSEAAKVKAEALKRAEERSAEYRSISKQLQDTITKARQNSGTAGNTALSAADEALQASSMQVNGAGSALHSVLSDSSVMEKYKKLVDEAREHFQSELLSIVPDLKIGEKGRSLTDDELDIFLTHAYRKVLHLQKELARIQTVEQQKLQQALERSGESGERVGLELEKQRRDLEIEFQKKMSQRTDEFEVELRRQLRRQAAAHSDHLQDALTAHGMESDRRTVALIDDALSQERSEHRSGLARLLGRVKGVEMALAARADTERAALAAQALWCACQGLLTAIRVSLPSVSCEEQRAQLSSLLVSVKNAAAPGDELVDVVLGSISPVASEQGVLPEDALSTRFNDVSETCRRMALVGDEGAPLPVFFLSRLQGALISRRSRFPTPQEVRNEPVLDTDSLDTYDIIDRARFCVDRGDIEQAVRYMGLLKGAPRIIARDWLKEAILMLEAKQAALTLVTYATSIHAPQ